MMIRQRKLIQTVGLAMVLMLSAFVAVPVLAQFALEHFAPREVEKLPIPRETVTLATVPPESYSENVKALEDQAGFSVLMPRYLPPTCRLRKSYYLAEPIGEIRLEYDDLIGNLPCLDVAQRRAQGDTVHRPFVGQGSTEEVIIKGEPALYINGAWIVESLSENGILVHLSPEEQKTLFEKAKWVPGPQQLIFEYKDLLIRIHAGLNISKEELVRIAESME